MKKRSMLIFVLIFIFGSLLRIYRFSETDVLTEEAFTIFRSHPAHLISDMIKYWFSVGHFPTYFITVHYWMRIFGTTEIAARLPSLIFGVMSIYAVFVLGAKCFDKKTGLLASYLFGVSTINICYSQYARPYATAEFFVLISFIFLLKAIEKNTNLSWLAHIFFTLLALLLSPSCLPVIICQILFAAFVFFNKKIISFNAHKFFFSLFIVTCLYLLVFLRLILPLINHGQITAIAHVKPSSYNNIIDILNIFGGKVYLFFFAYYNQLERNMLPTYLFSTLLFLFCLRGISKALIFPERGVKKALDKNGLILFLWLTLPFILPFVGSFFLASQSFLGPVRYVLYASVPYYVLVAKGIRSFDKTKQNLFIIIIIILSFIPLREYYDIRKHYRLNKRTDWKQVSSYINNKKKEDEKVAVAIKMIENSFMEFKTLQNYGIADIIGITDDRYVKGMPNFAGEGRIIKSEKWQWYGLQDLSIPGIWLIFWTPPRHVDFTPRNIQSDILNNLQQRYVLLEKKQFNNAELYHFRE